ncbi:MAG: glycosyltransferase [Candidatus Micrarchaeota archaeon]|nr:glycosyltransferase [Candidatus Micrarchaeota archaeon]
MKRYKVRIENVIFAIFLLFIIIRAANANSMIAIFDYHQIVPNTSITNQYQTNYSVFINQMNWLQQNGYHTITLAKLVSYMANGTEVPPNTVVLIFSDGYKSHRAIVEPILKSHGFVGTFCVVAGYMINGYPAFMNMSDVLYLQSQGNEICGHSYSHPHLVNASENLNGIPANWILELNVSTNIFRSNSINVTDFNVPYCSYNASLVKWVEALGYRATKLCMNGFSNFTNPSKDPRFNYTMFGQNVPYWGITDIEPNASLANLVLFSNIIINGNVGNPANITFISSPSASSSNLGAEAGIGGYNPSVVGLNYTSTTNLSSSNSSITSKRIANKPIVIINNVSSNVSVFPTSIKNNMDLIGLIVNLSLLVGYITILPILLLMVIAIFNKNKFNNYDLKYKDLPVFSLIVPAYNEELVIKRTIDKFLDTNYPVAKKEIIVVNDGSTDRTAEEVMKYAYKIINVENGKIIYKHESNNKNIILINNKLGGKGKAHVVNLGKKFARGDVLFFIDADVRVSRDVFYKAAKDLSDKSIGALAGYVEISRKKGRILNGFVDFEATIAQKVVRRGFDAIGVHYIIPGGCAIFRRKLLNEIGDYESDTLAEDTDITWRFASESKSKIRFDPNIVVVADEPNILINLWTQRVRWARGNIGVTLKHKNKIGKLKHGKMSTVGIPFWIATILIPITFLFATIGILLATIFYITVPVYISNLARLFAIAFYIIFFVGVILNRGRSWFGGLFAPGIPMLITLTSSLFWSTGLSGLLNLIGYGQYTFITGILLISWIIISIPFTFLLVELSKKHGEVSNFLQVLLFSYWMILVLSAIIGYIKEFKKEELIWLRTQRN